MSNHPLIFLTGFMGSGKTYWGTRLAAALNCPFYDLDQLIEAGRQQSVSSLFSEKGEAAFRELERETLHQTAALAPAVIATGGGAPCFFDNMDWMNRTGLSIFLNTPPDLLADRLKHERAFRPLLAQVSESELETYIAGLLQHRMPFYRQAHIELQQHADTSMFLNQLLAAVQGPPLKIQD